MSLTRRIGWRRIKSAYQFAVRMGDMFANGSDASFKQHEP
jgi:hypothetical protein